MKPELSKQVIDELAGFLEFHPPNQFSTALHRLLLDFMSREINTGFQINFGNLLWALNDLFDLLHLADTEIKNQITIPEPEHKRKRSRKPNHKL